MTKGDSHVPALHVIAANPAQKGVSVLISRLPVGAKKAGVLFRDPGHCIVLRRVI